MTNEGNSAVGYGGRRRASAGLLASLAAAFLACSPTAPSADPINLGGASSLWPAPSSSADPSEPTGLHADNPWLAGFGGAGGPEQTSGTTSADSLKKKTSQKEVSQEPRSAPRALIRGYWESSGAEKLLIIENLGDRPIEDCAVEVFSNGGTKPWRTLRAGAAVEPAQRRVLCVPDAFEDACDDVQGGTAYNGDDALVLSCEGMVLDSLGRVGEDPGESWQQGDLSTRDAGLLRCTDAPDPDAEDPVDLSEWQEWSPEQAVGAACSLGIGGAGPG